MITIYYIYLLNIDIDNLIKKLTKLGFQESYLNDLTFCPYLIIHKDFEFNKLSIYENINKGYLNLLKEKTNLIEDTSISSFIQHAKELIIEVTNNHMALF